MTAEAQGSASGRRLLVIHNPVAGRRRRKRFWEVLELLERDGNELTLHMTEAQGDAIAFAREIAPVAGAHEATTAQIVIAWTLQQPGITFALCGARNPGQAIENAAAGRILLSAEDIGQIDRAAETHLRDLDR